jgi:hypothetical protein
MADRDTTRTGQNSRDMNDEDRVRSRADEMEDASNNDEFDDTEDVDEEEEEEGEGSF